MKSNRRAMLYLPLSKDLSCRGYIITLVDISEQNDKEN